MRRSVNRLSFALVVLATAVVGARWVSVVSAQPMGMYAIYNDWGLPLEGEDVFGFGSVDELDTQGCFHGDYRTWLLLGSPRRAVERTEWGMSANESMPWNQEEGWWRVSTSASYFCNCGGGAQSVPTETLWFDLTVPHLTDAQKLQECLNVCQQGRAAIENFCRSLPNVPPYMRVVKALCWANRWTAPLCTGFCHRVWGD